MKRITLTALALVLIIGILGAGTFAWFTSAGATPTSTFTSGTLSLDGAGFASLDLGDVAANMAPGDITDPVVITIENDGSLPLAWFGDWEFTGGTKLREALYIDYAQMEFLKPDGTTWEPTDNFITNGVGSGPYPAWFNTLAGQSKFGVVTFAVWDGNNGMGSTPYEHMGALMPGYMYKLTVKFGFAKDAGNEYQGDQVSPVNVRLKVDATQVNADALNALKAGFGTNHLAWLNAQLDKQQ